MRYFVTADPHGFFTIMHDALIAQGFDEDNPEHKLVICGDLMDRGKEARKMQAYILSLLEKDRVILIRGNHEDLMLNMIEDMKVGDPFSLLYSHHASNKTLDTAYMNDTYIIKFYELDKNDYTTETVDAQSFEDALEHARRIQTKEQILTEIKIQEEQ